MGLEKEAMETTPTEIIHQPLVCIIIVNWNGAKVLLDCLKSIAEISYSNYKIVIIDNGSSDSSMEIVRSRYNETIDILIQNKNEGFARGNNIGIRYSMQKYQPSYLLLLNNDTVVDKYFLGRMVKAAEREKGVVAIVPKILYFDDPTLIWYAGGYINPITGIANHFGKGKHDQRRYSQSKEVSFMNGCSALIRKETVEKIGFFDERLFATGEDVDYSLRIHKEEGKIFYESSAVVLHKVSVSQNDNRGEWFSFYLATRSSVILRRKYSASIMLPLAMLCFGIRWVLYLELKYIMKVRFDICRAIVDGMMDGFSERLRFV